MFSARTTQNIVILLFLWSTFAYSGILCEHCNCEPLVGGRIIPGNSSHKLTLDQSISSYFSTDDFFSSGGIVQWFYQSGWRQLLVITACLVRSKPSSVVSGDVPMLLMAQAVMERQEATFVSQLVSVPYSESSTPAENQGSMFSYSAPSTSTYVTCSGASDYASYNSGGSGDDIPPERPKHSNSCNYCDACNNPFCFQYVSAMSAPPVEYPNFPPTSVYSYLPQLPDPMMMDNLQWMTGSSNPYMGGFDSNCMMLAYHYHQQQDQPLEPAQYLSPSCQKPEAGQQPPAVGLDYEQTVSIAVGRLLREGLMSDCNAGFADQDSLKRCVRLVHFLIHLLKSDTEQRIIEWTDQQQGFFHVIDFKALTRLWSQAKARRKPLAEEALKRSIRHLQTSEQIKKCEGAGNYQLLFTHRFVSRLYPSTVKQETYGDNDDPPGACGFSPAEARVRGK